MQFVGQKNDLKKHVGLLLVWEEGKRYYSFLTNTSENAYLCIIKQFKMKENIFSANVYKLLVQKKILKCQVKDWFKITW